MTEVVAATLSDRIKDLLATAGPLDEPRIADALDAPIENVRRVAGLLCHHGHLHRGADQLLHFITPADRVRREKPAATVSEQIAELIRKPPAEEPEAAEEEPGDDVDATMRAIADTEGDMQFACTAKREIWIYREGFMLELSPERQSTRCCSTSGTAPASPARAGPMPLRWACTPPAASTSSASSSRPHGRTG